MNDCVPIDLSKYWPKKVEVSVVGSENRLIVDDVQTLPHPVVVNLPKCGPSIKNRFLESMYLKYRNLLPKRPFGETIKAHPLDRFKTCYAIDYGLKEEPLEITRAPGSIHDDTYEMKWQFKDPEMPYLPGTCDSITKSHAQRWPTKPKPKELLRRQRVLPLSSEYNDNYNRMAKIFQKKNAYKKNALVFLKHQNTIYPFEKKL